MLTRTLAAICFATVSFTTLPFATQAASLPVPSVDYSADRVMESEAGTFTGKVFFSGGKERTEMSVGEMQTITIMRPDKQLAYRLMPAQRMYMQTDMATARQQTGSAGAENVDITLVGKESVEGVQATKYKLLMKGAAAGGFMWFTAEGIAVKMDLLSSEGGKKTRTTITLKNLVVGPLDPQTFEVPSDFNAMPNVGVRAAAPAKEKAPGQVERVVTEASLSNLRTLINRLPSLIK